MARKLKHPEHELAILRQAHAAGEFRCRLYHDAGKVDADGQALHKACDDLTARGYLRFFGMAGQQYAPDGQHSRWALSDLGRKLVEGLKQDG